MLLLIGGKKSSELMLGFGHGVNCLKDDVNEAKEEINRTQKDFDKPAEKK